jgi:WD40 repeat protein
MVSDRITEDGRSGMAGSGVGGRVHHHRGTVVKTNHRVTSVAIWETPSPGGMSVKLFTGSHDGKWRLYNVAHSSSSSSPQSPPGTASLVMEFEHAVGGPVDAVHVASNYFFVGFEACPIISPDARAGMVHGWNLDKANDPPSELWMNGTHAKYAGSGRVRCICTREDGRIWTGGNDGMIREWTYVPPHVVAGGGGGSGSGGEFALVRGMGGHLGAVTGLALSNGVLWSGGMDGTIRLWNVETGEHAHAIPALGKDAAKNGGGGGIMGGGPSSSSTATIATSGLTTGAGHSGPITGLLPFELPGVDDGGGGASSSMSFVFTSSLDETVRVWNATNGECVASERHGQGVTAIALSSDLRGNPLLLCGLFYGDIMIRGTVSNPPLCLLLKISHNYLGVGHEMGPVNDIQPGPGNTFYAVADDGKLTAWQITGDFGL